MELQERPEPGPLAGLLLLQRRMVAHIMEFILDKLDHRIAELQQLVELRRVEMGRRVQLLRWNTMLYLIRALLRRVLVGR
jgi:hypothetical protein